VKSSELFDSVAVANGFRESGAFVMQRTGTPPTILVVEDYADSRQMLKLLLETLNYEVLTAANGREALSVAANNHIDLILTDFDLPDMTGPTMVRYLRRRGNHSATVPIVMLTACEGYHYRKLAKQAGCDAFFVKPPDFEFLKRTVDCLLQEGQAKRDSIARVW
jgi:CheY-like chemotaxis protein